MQIRRNILEPWFMLHPMLNVTPQVKKPWNHSENLFFTDKSKILQCSLVADTNDLFLLFFLRSANMSTVWSKALKFCWKEKKSIFFLPGNSLSISGSHDLLNQITGPCRTGCTKNLSEVWDQQRKSVSPVIDCTPLAHAMSHSFPPYSCPRCAFVLWYRLELQDYLFCFVFSKWLEPIHKERYTQAGVNLCCSYMVYKTLAYS